TVYSSPRERTCSTAAPLATRLNLPLRTLDDIDELDFGEWQGMSFNALRDDPAWRRFNEHRGATRPPGGELAGEAQERFITAMRHLSTEQPAACVALVSHGDPIRYALARCLGLSLDAVHRLQVDLASVSVVSWEGDARVLCINR